MNLYELSFTSYVYSRLTKFDDSYQKFLDKTNNNLDLFNPSHREHLLKWLNDWKCRNFYRTCHKLASGEILSWYKKYNNYLPSREINMWELMGQDLELIQTAYNNLKLKKASHITKNSKEIIKKVGDTGSSKILFSLRPKSLIPWDETMRKYFKRNYNLVTYSSFLLRVIEEIKDLEKYCQKENLELLDIPNLLKKSNMTIPKIIDEYHWIRITNSFTLPYNEILKKWLKWNK